MTKMKGRFASRNHAAADVHPGMPDGTFRALDQRDLTFILDGMGDIFRGKRHGAILCGGVSRKA